MVHIPTRAKFYSRPLGAKAAEESWQRCQCEKDWMLRTNQSPWVGRHVFKASAVGGAMLDKGLRRLVITGSLSVVFRRRDVSTHRQRVSDSVCEQAHGSHTFAVPVDNGRVLFDPSIMDVFSRVYSGAGRSS